MCGAVPDTGRARWVKVARHETNPQARLDRLGILGTLGYDLCNLQTRRGMVAMVDEYSVTQTDQLTEVFKAGMSHAQSIHNDTKGDFAWAALAYIIWELERDRALWPDVRMLYHYLSNKYRQIPLSERG